MGNRAVVIFHDKKGKFSPGIYLHYNGGFESINAFLNEMNRRNVRGSDDLDYCVARFVHIVCDFFDQNSTSTTGVGIFNIAQKSYCALEELSSGDNGVFLVYREENKNIISRPNGEILTVEGTETKRYAEEIAKVFSKIRPNVGG